MFEKLEDLAKNNKRVSDFRMSIGSQHIVKLVGVVVKDVPIKAQDLKDLMSMNCNEGRN